MPNEERMELAWHVGRVAMRAVERMGDPERALRWLTDPHPALGGEAPIRRCGTDRGDAEVLRMLECSKREPREPVDLL